MSKICLTKKLWYVIHDLSDIKDGKMAVYKGIYRVVTWDGLNKRWSITGNKIDLYKDGENFVDVNGVSYTIARKNHGKKEEKYDESPLCIGGISCVKKVL